MIRRAFLAAVLVVLVAGAGRKREARYDGREVTMADSVWISTDGNLNAAGSWSPSGVPGAAGNIALNSSSQVDMVSGLTALSGIDIARFWITSDYFGNVGADGNYLTTGIHNLIHQGGGSLYYSMEDHASSNYVVIKSPNQQDAFIFKSVGSALSPNMYFLDGGVTILDGAGALGFTFVGGGTGTNNLPIVTIGTGVTMDTYVQRGGYVTTKSVNLGSGTHCLVDGGTLVVDKTVTSAWTGLIEIAGGTLQYNGTGTIGIVFVSSGILDMSKDPRAKTITRLVLLPGAIFISNNNTTVTNLTDLRGTVPVLP